MRAAEKERDREAAAATAAEAAARAQSAAEMDAMARQLANAKEAKEAEAERASQIFAEAEQLQQEVAALRRRLANAGAGGGGAEASHARSGSPGVCGGDGVDGSTGGGVESNSAAVSGGAAAVRSALAVLKSGPSESVPNTSHGASRSPPRQTAATLPSIPDAATSATSATASTSAAPAAALSSKAEIAPMQLTPEQQLYLRQCMLAFLEARDSLQEELWPPIALTLQFSTEEVARIQGAVRARHATCADLLADPTLLAQAQPRAHAALSACVRAAVAVGSGAFEAASVAWTHLVDIILAATATDGTPRAGGRLVDRARVGAADTGAAVREVLNEWRSLQRSGASAQAPAPALPGTGASTDTRRDAS
eukprot:3714410-Pleurochrysis_carterae.AAC.3